jgi:hypothetical protein
MRRLHNVSSTDIYSLFATFLSSLTDEPDPKLTPRALRLTEETSRAVRRLLVELGLRILLQTRQTQAASSQQGGSHHDEPE